MTSKDESKLSITNEKLKARRELLEISQKEMAKDLDISVRDIERYENLKSPDIPTCDTIRTEIQKYLVEIYDPEKNRLGSRELDLLDFDGINLLLKKLKSEYDYIIEFCGRIKPGGKIYDEFDGGIHEDNNILEITNIKMVKKNAKN